MKLSVRSQNFRLQSETEEFAQRKLENLTRYLPNIREIRMELNRQENRGIDNTIAQVTLTHERGAILRTEERIAGFSRDTIELAVSAALDKMYARIKRFKGKQQDARTRAANGRYSATLAELEAAEELPAFEAAEAEEEQMPSVVVRRKDIPLSMMDEHDAIDQMELLGHTFFMYRDIANNKVSVVYKRHDGTYGLLAPAES